MNKKEPYNPQTPFSLPRPSSRDLRGKQSVRATFRLSKQAVETISILAVQLGIKQKSLFDHLIEDMETLDLIARRLDPNVLRNIPRVQKTYVLNRRTLRYLDQTSREYNAPRDALVEYSIQRLMPVINRELARHRARKKMVAETEEMLRRGERMLRKMITSLGREDPISTEFASAVRALRDAQQKMEACVDKGEELEEFLASIESK